jgi:hypothetical protein
MNPWEGVAVPCLGRTSLFYCAEDKINEVEKAKKICKTQCPITRECEAYAIRERIEFGIWGGYLPDERRARTPYLERLDPTTYLKPHRTLDALWRQLNEPLPFPERRSSQEIRILLVFGSSVEEQTPSHSPDTETLKLRFDVM